jgi:hypothetical protein
MQLKYKIGLPSLSINIQNTSKRTLVYSLIAMHKI